MKKVTFLRWFLLFFLISGKKAITTEQDERKKRWNLTADDADISPKRLHRISFVWHQNLAAFQRPHGEMTYSSIGAIIRFTFFSAVFRENAPVLVVFTEYVN